MIQGSQQGSKPKHGPKILSVNTSANTPTPIVKISKVLFNISYSKSQTTHKASTLTHIEKVMRPPLAVHIYLSYTHTTINYPQMSDKYTNTL